MRKEIIKNFPTNDIIPYERNCQKHERNVQDIANSLCDFGYLKISILIDENNVLIAGHGTVEAAKMLKWEVIPEVCKVMDMPDDMKKAYRIADNSTAKRAEWDFRNLDIELNTPNFKYDMANYGLNYRLEIGSHDGDENDVPAQPTTPRTCRGDVYEFGKHRLICGDATSPTDIAKLMEDKKAEMLFTSPPYSNMREYNGNKNLAVENLKQFVANFYEYCNFQCINFGLQRKNNSIYEYYRPYIDAAINSGYLFLAWNVWVKNGAGSIGSQRAFFPINHEWIFVFGKFFKDINRTEVRKLPIRTRLNKHRNADGTMQTHAMGRQEEFKELESAVYIPIETTNKTGHPAVYPVELPEVYINALSNAGDIIVEPFAGRGSTLIAAEKVGRTCFCMELDECFCDVIVYRYLRFTGQKNVLKNGKKITW